MSQSDLKGSNVLETSALENFASQRLSDSESDGTDDESHLASASVSTSTPASPPVTPSRTLQRLHSREVTSPSLQGAIEEAHKRGSGSFQLTPKQLHDVTAADAQESARKAKVRARARAIFRVAATAARTAALMQESINRKKDSIRSLQESIHANSQQLLVVDEDTQTHAQVHAQMRSQMSAQIAQLLKMQLKMRKVSSTLPPGTQ